MAFFYGYRDSSLLMYASARKNLDEGQNRFRVKQGISNGKFSESSDSIFINIENVISDEDDSEETPDLPIILVILTILFSAYVFKKGDFDD